MQVKFYMLMTMYSTLISFCIIILSFILLVRADFELNIVHLNDVHSYFFETKKYDQFCTDEDFNKSICIGGIARQVTKIKEIRDKEKNVIVLSAGDFFLGQSFNPLHGWRFASAMFPYLGVNVTSLGNHDFHGGDREAASYIFSLKCPVVCCNMQWRRNSFWSKNIQKSVILDVGGEKVGIIGFIHPQAKRLSLSGSSFDFTDVYRAVNEEVARLKSADVKYIIALGHAGYYVNKKIAKTIPGVQVVVGGHSQFLKSNPNGENSTQLNSYDTKWAHLTYPKIVPKFKASNLDKDYFVDTNFALVVEVPQHAKYLGHLKVTFNNKGDILSFSGSPIFLDNTIEKDQQTENMLQRYRKVLINQRPYKYIPEYNKILGVVKVDLIGGIICRIRECTLGNFITDAVLHSCAKNIDNSTQEDLVDAAVWNSGSLRNSIQAGKIRTKDLTHAIQLGDRVCIIEMNGSMIKEMMEHSVKQYDVRKITPSGAFLQVSGMRVIYDVSLSQGHRVVNITIQNWRENRSEYKILNHSQKYNIAMPEYLKRGGDWYPIHEENSCSENLIDLKILAEYLEDENPIWIQLQKRLIIQRKKKGKSHNHVSQINRNESSFEHYEAFQDWFSNLTINPDSSSFFNNSILKANETNQN